MCEVKPLRMTTETEEILVGIARMNALRRYPITSQEPVYTIPADKPPEPVYAGR